MTTIMIAEKPTAAKSIAESLADKGTLKVKEGEQGVKYYEFNKDRKKHIVVAAVGHLFSLKQVGKGWSYPAFDVEWIPSFQASRTAAFSKKYYDVVASMAKNGDEYIICCDYDEEGSVIGFNILKFICGKKNAKRMKFSTMTKEELVESYKNASKELDFGQIESGLTRHYLDWYYGINLTRALTNALKTSNKRFRILSTGRVQGPMLHMLAKHEKKIKAFKPKPFWQIELDVAVGKDILKAQYEKSKLWNKKDADDILKKSQVKDALIADIQTKLFTQKPPKPYNTTSLLADIYRYFGYSPTQGMSIAESLYQAGLISYPRTSSEKLPKDINYKKIISNLGKQKSYEKESKILLAGELKPEEGARTDSAHPAIYPTGEDPKKIGAVQKKVYDLVVRRFLAVFGKPAKRESQKIVLDVNGNKFSFSGKKTIDAGWTFLYGKYAQRDEVILPAMKKGDRLTIKKISQLQKETQPPPRFSQGSVLKELEERNLGTKATRAQILQILYNRGYIVGRSIEVTELGMNLADVLEKSASMIVSEKLTRHFEEECDKVLQGKMKKEDVLEEAKKTLIAISDEFKKKEKKIGNELTKAVIAAQDKQNKLGACPNCKGTLKVHKNWRTGKRFVGCSGYPKGCRTGFPLPREGLILSTEKICEECKTPIIQVRREGGKPFRMCLDPECKTKGDWLDKNKLKKIQAESKKSSADALQEKNKEKAKEAAKIKEKTDKEKKLLK